MLKNLPHIFGNEIGNIGQYGNPFFYQICEIWNIQLEYPKVTQNMPNIEQKQTIHFFIFFSNNRNDL